MAKPPEKLPIPVALPHLDERGHARMVDVGAKASTHRVAVAEAFIRMLPETLRRLEAGALAKGDALAVARIAGIQAAKKAWELIPLAHPIGLTHAAVDVSLEPERGGVRVETRVETVGTTGVEMEAMVAAATAALAIYDMAKAHDRGMVVERVQLVMKSGGKSGTYRRAERRGDTDKVVKAVAQPRAKAQPKTTSKATAPQAKAQPKAASKAKAPQAKAPQAKAKARSRAER
jgi:cyclic pyranopterin phosphate synthase